MGAARDGCAVRSAEATAERQQRFLAAIATLPSVTRAAAAANIGVATHYDWLEKDPTYAARYKEARARGYDALESACAERAQAGVKRLVCQGGKPVEVVMRDAEGAVIMRPSRDPKTGKVVMDADGAPVMEPATEYVYETVYSDRLAERMLEAHKPEDYTRRSKVDLDVAGELATRLVAARRRLKQGGAVDVPGTAGEGAKEP